MIKQTTPELDTPVKPSQALRQEIRRFLNSPKTMTVATAIVILVIAGLAFGFITGQSMNDSESSVGKIAKNEPQYTTLLPEATSIKQLGGWTRVSPPGSSPVFAFQDDIDGTGITVTQQPLPSSFKGDVAGKLAQLAKGYSATTELKADKTVFYLGNSAKGPQSVLFVKDGVLMLIKSDKVIADKKWIAYILLLKTPMGSTIPKY